MAKEQIGVYLKPAAEKQITAISIYIEEKGFPVTAEKFAEKLNSFAESLADFPEKFPICRNRIFRNRNYRCAVYQKNYIFVYKFRRNQIMFSKYSMRAG